MALAIPRTLRSDEGLGEDEHIACPCRVSSIHDLTGYKWGRCSPDRRPQSTVTRAVTRNIERRSWSLRTLIGMTRQLGSLLGLLMAVQFAACGTEDSTASAQFAVDTDDNGAVDCTDLDHVVTCLHHHGTAACDHADVNHDGVVDHEDLHDIYDGLAATGHHCTDPAHQDPADHVLHH